MRAVLGRRTAAGPVFAVGCAAEFPGRWVEFGYERFVAAPCHPQAVGIVVVKHVRVDGPWVFVSAVLQDDR